MTEPMTRGQIVANDVSALLRARNSLLWIVTREEARVERLLVEAAAAAGYIPRTWDAGQGVCDLAGKRSPFGSADIGETLASIRTRAEAEVISDRGVWILRDLAPWLVNPLGIVTTRQVRNLARFLPGIAREKAQAIVVLTPSGNIPEELQGHAVVIEWPLPDRREIEEILTAAIDALPEEMQATAAPNGAREAAIDAALGLTGEEAASCYARSIVQLRRIDPIVVAQEKKRVIAREKVLEWYDPIPGGLDAVGGLENLKTWLLSRSIAYTAKAREYGLPSPKGAFLVGVPGCGKSLIAKAIATAWGCPLIKMDMGALKSKFVGDSEQNLRKSFRVIEAIGRCVVWLDEIEKSLQGATSGSADGGVSADALGAVLTWMQERKTDAFVIATANDVETLPPELLRKGRFDDLWFIDLPTGVERIAILHATLKTFGRNWTSDESGSLGEVAMKCQDFTGAELAALVPEAMFAAFADNGREIQGRDLVEAAKTVVPLAITAKNKIEKLREWAGTRARPASIRIAPTGKFAILRALDI